MPSLLSDQEILNKIKKGIELSPEVVQAIYREKGASGYYYILKECKDAEMAKEVLQDAIVSFVFQVKTGKLNSIDNLKAYLTRSCKNIWLNNQKKKKPVPIDVMAVAETHKEIQKPSDSIEQASRAKMIREVMGLIQEKCRKILTWSIAEGRPMDWIASQVNLGSAQAAMNQKSRCKKSLIGIVAGNPAYTQLVEELLEESVTHT